MILEKYKNGEKIDHTDCAGVIPFKFIIFLSHSIFGASLSFLRSVLRQI